MKKNEREIPKKNYTTYTIIIVVTLLTAIVAFVAYNNKKQYEKSIPVLRGHSKEIELGDIDAYFTENNDALLYVGVSNEDESRALEEEMIDLIDNNHLEVIYLNLKDVNDVEKFYIDFNKKYSKGIDLTSNPAFVIIKDGKILDLVQRENRKLNVGDVIQLLEINDVIGEDHA